MPVATMFDTRFLSDALASTGAMTDVKGLQESETYNS